MSVFNSHLGKFGVGMMILQAAKTGFFISCADFTGAVLGLMAEFNRHMKRRAALATGISVMLLCFGPGVFCSSNGSSG